MFKLVLLFVRRLIFIHLQDDGISSGEEAAAGEAANADVELPDLPFVEMAEVAALQEHPAVPAADGGDAENSDIEFDEMAIIGVRREAEDLKPRGEYTLLEKQNKRVPLLLEKNEVRSAFGG